MVNVRASPRPPTTVRDVVPRRVQELEPHGGLVPRLLGPHVTTTPVVLDQLDRTRKRTPLVERLLVVER
ncbi:MAG: hypothetical protein WCA31_12325 [Acidimicrobiales bacterium]